MTKFQRSILPVGFRSACSFDTSKYAEFPPKKKEKVDESKLGAGVFDMHQYNKSSINLQ